MSYSDYEIEVYARSLLLQSGLIEVLKPQKIYVWTIRAYGERLTVLVDISRNKQAKLQELTAQIREVLAPLERKIDVQSIPILELCCYGNCRGCLNGDPETQPLFVGHLP